MAKHLEGGDYEAKVADGIQPTLIVAGGLGFAGSELVRQAIESDQYSEIFVCGRSKGGVPVADRVVKTLKIIANNPAINGQYLDEHNVIPVDFNGINPNNLGLSEEVQDTIKRSLSESGQALIVGATGDVRFLQSTDDREELKKLHDTNVLIPKNILEYAEHLTSYGNVAFGHIGTAFDNGKPEINCNLFYKNAPTPDTTNPDNFCNEYERFKALIREYIRDYQGKVKTVILNPSIIVGQSENGANPYESISLDGMYGFLKAMFTGQALASRSGMDSLNLMGDENTKINMVTVDKFIKHLLLRTNDLVRGVIDSGTIINLTAPSDEVLTYRQIMDIGGEVYGKIKHKTSLPINISNEFTTIPSLEQYRPYVNYDRNFGQGVPGIGVNEAWLRASLLKLATRKFQSLV